MSVSTSTLLPIPGEPDTDSASANAVPVEGAPYEKRTPWALALAAAPMGLVHVAALGVFFTGASTEVAWACVALWLGRTGFERALLIGCLFLVLIVELLNSAVEAAVDRVSFEKHPLAKRAKDIGSAAVMLSIVNAAVVWLLILL